MCSGFHLAKIDSTEQKEIDAAGYEVLYKVITDDRQHHLRTVAQDHRCQDLASAVVVHTQTEHEADSLRQFDPK